VLKWGTGALNIDASRIGTDVISTHGSGDKLARMKTGESKGVGEYRSHVGRFPSHLILDEEAGAMLDEMSGTLKSGAMNGVYKNTMMKNSPGQRDGKPVHLTQAASEGGASRFFYCAKVSASERNAGLEGMPDYVGSLSSMTTRGERERGESRQVSTTKNHHPTVKPQKLMRYLVRMITPPGGTVLDCFMGSGSTGLAALTEGFSFVGIEREPEYLEIASKRIFSAFPEFKKEYAGAEG